MVDTSTHRRRKRNRIAPLAIIVLVLLAIMAVIAFVRADGTPELGDRPTEIPVDRPDEAVMPPNGAAPEAILPPETTPNADPGVQPEAPGGAPG